MKFLFWLVCCICAFVVYQAYYLKKENRELQHEVYSMKTKIQLREQETTLCQESLHKYETAFATLEKKYPKVAAQFDLFVNGIER